MECKKGIMYIVYPCEAPFLFWVGIQVQTPINFAYTSQVQCWLIFTAVMVVLNIIKFLRCCCWWIFVMLACVYKRIKLKGEDFTNIKWVLSFQEHVQNSIAIASQYPKTIRLDLYYSSFVGCSFWISNSSIIFVFLYLWLMIHTHICLFPWI